MKTVYLDSAATSFPKPCCVIKAMNEAMVKRGGNPGRSGHILSMSASRDIYKLRENAADFFGRENPEHVIITGGNTAALNLALKTVLVQDDVVLCSDIEHNAVRRPLNSLEKTGVKFFRFTTDDDDKITLANVENLIRTLKPKALVCNHSSNVFPRILPVKEIGGLCRKYNVLFILDAAQSGGHININVDLYSIDALCLPGHKGLYGPSGIGLLIISRKFSEAAMKQPTLIQGGAGIDSLDNEMPASFPERFEAGTQASFLCAGLSAGIDFVRNISVRRIGCHEDKLCSYAEDVLSEIKGIRLYGIRKRAESKQNGVISFNLSGKDPEALASELSEKGICLRAGLHCAPEAHSVIGTLESGGTVRLSVGIFNSMYDIDIFSSALRNIIKRDSHIR